MEEGSAHVDNRGWLREALTPLVGRRREIADLGRLMDSNRLVTIVGAGGAGKTRLARHVARECAPDYPDGLWFVTLESIADPELVPRAVAAQLGVREEHDRAFIETLSGYLRPKQCLLVLDNCEHVALACARLAEAFLQLCPKLRILATSRQSLGINGETTWRIPPLAVPHAGHSMHLERLRQVESIELFLDRARAASDSFVMTDQNAGAVVEICQRLDGMPLAL
jgi:predicted ATPase